MNSDLSFCVVEAQEFFVGNKHYDAIQSLRFDVLRKPLGMAPTVPFRLDGPSSFHILACRQSDKAFVGTVSVALEGKESRGRIYQMAVIEECRGHNVGKRLLEKAVEEAKIRGAKKAYLHARHYAIGFYKKAGFKEVGERFMEINMEHCEMEMDIN